jgi:adenine deaminase
MKIVGNLIDVHLRDIYPAIIRIEDGIIADIERTNDVYDHYILPGFIDSHVHIESSMVTPGAFALTAVRHGTIGAISDPHEIANVMGLEGIDYMLTDGRKVPFYFWFGAPSCVPATPFESSGAIIGAFETDELLKREEIKYLSEMMNYPGVINNDDIVYKKIRSALKYGKPIDGHAPGLSGKNLEKYVDSGISTDHECSNIDEAREKIRLGMKILIREGSAARNLNALKPLFREYPEMIMLCSDDIHPEMLIERHISKIAAELISEKYNIFDVLRACSFNPVMHYNLEAGLLRKDDSADFIIVKNPEKMDVMGTWIHGRKIYDGTDVLFGYKKGKEMNRFFCSALDRQSLQVTRTGEKMRVIEAYNGELLTGNAVVNAGHEAFVESDILQDVLKIVVKDRYYDRPASVGFIKGFGLQHGAFASSVAHDSHNIICVGVKDDDIEKCINTVIEMQGGLAVCSGDQCNALQLRIGGIMSDDPCEEVAEKYEDLSEKVKAMGCKLSAPFMTLSFMALLVIPSLKISDKGLFDVDSFSFTPLFV